MKTVTLLALILMISVSAAVYAAPDKTVEGPHAELNMACADCHGTDTPDKRAPASACTGCHGEYADIAKLTEKVEPNPHKSHQGEIRCTICHKVHMPSVVYCAECHDFGLKIK